MSRCVRRAFLCGDGYEQRKELLLQQIEIMARCFSVEILAYAVMSNHFHLVVRTRPDLTDNWTDEEVLERWLDAKYVPGLVTWHSDRRALDSRTKTAQRLCCHPARTVGKPVVVHETGQRANRPDRQSGRVLHRFVLGRTL